jgi:uncharacterized protein DUF6603
VSVALELPPEVSALGLLIGLLTETDGTTTLQPSWFENPQPYFASADQRLGTLADLIAAALPPATGTASPPPVFTGAQWYAIPDPTGNGTTPFCLVAPGPGTTSGEIGLGVLYTTTAGKLTVEAYGYLPLVDYTGNGAEIVTTSTAHPTQLGVRAVMTDGSPFVVDPGQSDQVTFTAMSAATDLYLNASAYSQSPLPTFFTLTFEDFNGTGQNDVHHSMADLLEPAIDARIADVLLQASTWLRTYIGDAPITVGDILVAGHFLAVDDKGNYQVSLANIEGHSAEDIVLSFVFGAIEALADADMPYAAIELPGGGLYFVARENSDGTTDYGMRLALTITATDGDAASGKPGVDVMLGSWLTGETDATSWVARSTGKNPDTLAEPGLNVYLLHQGNDPTDVSFTPSFAISSVGVNVHGAAPGKALVNVEGVTIGGVELRAYLDEHSNWTVGGAARVDNVGIPLGPNFNQATGTTTTNPVAQNLLASGSSQSGSGPAAGGDKQPVNPTLSLSGAWVEGSPFVFQLYDATGAAAEQVMLPVQRSLGPLTVQRLGAGWVQSTHELSLLLDAGVEVGTLSVDLTGLSVGIPIKTPGDFSKYDLDLQGLGITFEAGEVELSAALVKVPPSTTSTPPRDYTEYDGEALLKAGTFEIVAIGSYAHAVTNGDGYTSLFVFGVLDANLGGPPFFYVTGVAAGFGYNRQLLLPDMSSVTTFPLVEAASDPTKLGATKNSDGSWTMPNPAQALEHIDQYVPPQRGAYWLTAGVRFTSFDLINSTALLVVEFGNELEIALLGLSAISLPPPPAPGAEAPATRYAYAELGIEIKLLPSQGEFSATAILTSNSFVLDPACKLTGGFAFYVWFGSNEHAGQFVLTLGGYHPDFHPPAYYPQVPRLGFDWPMTGDVTVSGQSYFALTPSAVMAGGALEVLFASGDLKAWLTAHMDALIEWAPFHYEIGIGISIGVSYRLHLLFVTVTLSFELGADLEIWGPPTGGTVHVELYVVSFTVGFGADRQGAPDPLPWTNDDGTGFAQTLLPHSSPSSSQPQERAMLAAPAPAASTTSEPSGVFTISPTGGVITSFMDGPATVYVVTPSAFTFAVTTTIPATEVDLEAPTGTPPTVVTPTAKNYFVAIRPMKATLSKSVLSVTVNDDDHQKVVTFADDFTYQPTLAGVPAAKFGQPLADNEDPKMNELLDGRLLGVQNVTPKGPTLTPAGPDALSMDVDTTFTYDTVDRTDADHLPLAPGAPAPQKPPVVDTATEFSTVKSTLMNANVVTNRGDVFAALQTLGVDAGTDGDLTAFAADPGAYLTDDPLLYVAS